jgi:hypothetical protein
MNTCPNNSNLKCPYALSIDSPLPCFGTQEQNHRNQTKIG